jgi:hypothetical protein
MRARWHAPTENNRNPLIMKKIRTRGAPGSEMTPDPSAGVPFNETFRQLNEMLKEGIEGLKEWGLGGSGIVNRNHSDKSRFTNNDSRKRSDG